MKNIYEKSCDQVYFPGQRVENIATWKGSKKSSFFGKRGRIVTLQRNGYQVLFDGDESPTMFFGQEELKRIGKKVPRPAL